VLLLGLSFISNRLFVLLSFDIYTWM